MVFTRTHIFIMPACHNDTCCLYSTIRQLTRTDCFNNNTKAKRRSLKNYSRFFVGTWATKENHKKNKCIIAELKKNLFGANCQSVYTRLYSILYACKKQQGSRICLRNLSCDSTITLLFKAQVCHENFRVKYLVFLWTLFSLWNFIIFLCNEIKQVHWRPCNILDSRHFPSLAARLYIKRNQTGYYIHSVTVEQLLRLNFIWRNEQCLLFPRTKYYANNVQFVKCSFKFIWFPLFQLVYNVDFFRWDKKLNIFTICNLALLDC